MSEKTEPEVCEILAHLKFLATHEKKDGFLISCMISPVRWKQPDLFLNWYESVSISGHLSSCSLQSHGWESPYETLSITCEIFQPWVFWFQNTYIQGPIHSTVLSIFAFGISLQKNSTTIFIIHCVLFSKVVQILNEISNYFLANSLFKECYMLVKTYFADPKICEVSYF